jgi:hypothetical protein
MFPHRLKGWLIAFPSAVCLFLSSFAFAQSQPGDSTTFSHFRPLPLPIPSCLPKESVDLPEAPGLSHSQRHISLDPHTLDHGDIPIDRKLREGDDASCPVRIYQGDPNASFVFVVSFRPRGSNRRPIFQRGCPRSKGTGLGCLFPC